MLLSPLELPGSPIDLPSWLPDTPLAWDPTAELLSGEVPTSPSLVVLAYDPQFTADTSDVTATVVKPGSLQLGSGANAGRVLWIVAAASLSAGLEYRFELKAVSSLGSNPARYLRVRCPA